MQNLIHRFLLPSLSNPQRSMECPQMITLTSLWAQAASEHYGPHPIQDGETHQYNWCFSKQGSKFLPKIVAHTTQSATRFSELLNGNEPNLVLKYHFNFTPKYFSIFYFALLASYTFTEYWKYFPSLNPSNLTLFHLKDIFLSLHFPLM